MRTALDPRAPQHNPKFSINHFNIIQDGTWADLNIPQSYQLPHHQAIHMSRIPQKPSEYLRIPTEYPPNTPQGNRQQSALGHEGRGRPPTRQARRLPRPKAPSRKPQPVSCGFRARLPRFPALPNLRQVNAATLSLPDRTSQSVKKMP